MKTTWNDLPHDERAKAIALIIDHSARLDGQGREDLGALLAVAADYLQASTVKDDAPESFPADAGGPL